MNLRIVLPMLVAMISTFFLAEVFVMSRVLQSGIDSTELIQHRHHILLLPYEAMVELQPPKLRT